MRGEAAPALLPSASALAGSSVCCLSWHEPAQHLSSLAESCDISATHIPSLTSPPLRDQVCLSVCCLSSSSPAQKAPAFLPFPPLLSWDFSCTLGSLDILPKKLSDQSVTEGLLLGLVCTQFKRPGPRPSQAEPCRGTTYNNTIVLCSPGRWGWGRGRQAEPPTEAGLPLEPCRNKVIACTESHL